MLVNRKCIDCDCKFSYDLTGKRIRKLCFVCAYNRRQESNRRNKENNPEKYKAYSKVYYQRVRAKQLEE